MIRPDAPVDLTQRLCDIVSRDPGLWIGSGAAEQERIVDLAITHGMHALLYEGVARAFGPGVGGSAVARLRQHAHTEAARSVSQAKLFSELFAMLQANGVRCLVIKGFPLAHSHYSAPYLRPRSDVDILFEQSAITAVHALFIEAGLRCDPLVLPMSKARYLTTQFCCERIDPSGLSVTVDAHWRINNAVVLADALDFDELYAQSVAQDSIAAGVRSTGAVHSLLIAALHRVADGRLERLIWLYDMHLLVTRMDDVELDQAVRCAIHKRLAAVLLDGLRRIRVRFGTGVDDALEQVLASAAARAREPAALLLRPGAGHFVRRVADLWSLPGWRSRLAMLWSMVSPPAAYLGLQHRSRSRRWIDWLSRTLGLRADRC